MGSDRIALLLGSGISKDSGAPMVNEITTKVLESPWYKGTDSRFYPVPPSEGLESRGYAAKAQNLIRLVHEQIKDHIFVRERRTPNYEDFFSCLKQIVQDETNDIVNPLITKNVELLKTAASVRGCPNDC